MFANAVCVDISSLHGTIIILYIPIHAVTVHFSKYEARVVGEIHLSVLDGVHRGGTAAENACYKLF